MANIFEINRVSNKITLGTTGTIISIASHTASRLLALDTSKNLEVVTIGSSLDYTRPTLNTIQDIRTSATPTFNALFLNEQASAFADETGDGQIWVKNTTPNILMFTDDEGTDKQLLTYVDRGDLTSWDYLITDFIRDGDWHDLDLSAIIPVNTKIFVLRLEIKGDAASLMGEFKTKGNTYWHNISTIITQAIQVKINSDFVVKPDADRVIEYRLSASDITDFYFIIKGWFI